MGRDDDQVWSELVASFHASDEVEHTWPDVENLDHDPAPSSPGRAEGDHPAGTAPEAAGTDAGQHRGEPGDVRPPQDDGPRDEHLRDDDRSEHHDAAEDAATDRPGPQHPRERPRPADGEHYVPPDPPPIPRTDLITMAAWGGVFGTPVLFAFAYAFGIHVHGLVSFIALIAFIGGFAVLISRLRGHDPDDPDSGAVV